MKVKIREASRGVSKTKERLRGMEKVDEKLNKKLNYGSDEEAITVASVKAGMLLYEAKLELYNKAKITVADLATELAAAEKEIESWAGRVLSSAKGKFNGDSVLIEILGGTPTSKRKAPRRKAVLINGNATKVA